MTVQTHFDLERSSAPLPTVHTIRAPSSTSCATTSSGWRSTAHAASSPALMHGLAAVAEMLRGVAERGITTTVVDGLIAGDRGAISRSGASTPRARWCARTR